MDKELNELIAKATEVGVDPSLMDLARGMTDSKSTAILMLKQFIDAKKMKLYEQDALAARTHSKLYEQDALAARTHSIQSTYGTNSGDFKLPKIQLNKDAKPSIKGKRHALAGVDADDAASDENETPTDDDSGSSDHTSTKDSNSHSHSPAGSIKSRGHLMEKRDAENKKREVVVPEAEICKLTKEQELCVPIAEVKIPLRDRNFQILFSGMAIEQDSLGLNKNLEYADEADVQNLCYTLVKDALKVLGLDTDDVRPHLEVSIYTMRPDIILVLRREGKIFFAIEVKSPELRKGEVFENGKVSYQLFTYLLALYAMGDEAPMAAIMTYNKIALVTLSDYADKEKIKQAVQQASKIFGDGSFNERVPTETAKPCAQRDDTPVKNIVVCTERVHTQEQYDENLAAAVEESVGFEMDEPDKDGHKKITPKVYMSEVHSEGSVFPFLLQALQVAYLKGTGAQDGVAAMGQNEALGGRLAFRVSEDAFHWYKLKQVLTATIHNSNFAHKSNKDFFIMGKLGEGKSGSVHIAITTSGYVFAMKIYNLKPITRSKELEKIYIREKEEQLDHEVRRWEELYGSKGRGFRARWLWLGGSPCLLMPYGDDLVSPEDDNSEDFEDQVNRARWKALPAVKKELSRFASKGYEYQSSDLRWGHVLMNPVDRQVFFCDLESLAEKSFTNETQKKAVWSQLAILLRPMVGDVSLKETLKWAAKINDKRSSIILENPEIAELAEVCDEDFTDFARFVNKPFNDLTDEEKVFLYALHYWEGDGKTKNESDSPKSHNSSEPSLNSGNGVSKAEEPIAKRRRFS